MALMMYILMKMQATSQLKAEHSRAFPRSLKSQDFFSYVKLVPYDIGQLENWVHQLSNIFTLIFYLKNNWKAKPFL